MNYKKLWIALAIVITGSFAVLGGVGYKMISGAPPIPSRVVTTEGTLLFNGSTIQDGQGVWQSIGGQEIGSIWGHGAYVAPDWTADWLHRESLGILDGWARQLGQPEFHQLNADQQAVLRARLVREMRTNTYDPTTRTITVSPLRAQVFRDLEHYYAGIFGNGRSEYAIPKGALTDSTKQMQMAAFFWWTAWAATTQRPGSDITYTNSWPHEPLVANEPTSAAVVWSIVSFVVLLGGIGGMVWYFASQDREPVEVSVPKQDPLLGYQ